MAHAMSSWISARVAERIEWDAGLVTLRLDPLDFPFKPGQFTNLAVEIDGKHVRRSYSIASAPGAPLEFYLKEVDGGALSPRLTRLAVGDRVLVEPRAAGFLTLDWLPDFAREMWLIATGTGLGPYISLLRSGALFERFDRIVFVHGARHSAELAYRDELVAAARDPRVSYLPVVSREEPRDGILGGRLTHLLSDGRLEESALLPLNLERSHVFLCGNPEMIADTVGLLEARGLRRHKRREPGHITTEKYW